MLNFYPSPEAAAGWARFQTLWSGLDATTDCATTPANAPHPMKSGADGPPRQRTATEPPSVPPRRDASELDSAEEHAGYSKARQTAQARHREIK